MAKKPKILAADNTKVALRYMETVLCDDYEVALVQTGSDVLDYLESSTPDLVLMNASMSGMDGFEVLKSIRSNDKLKYIRIILLSSKSDINERLKGYGLGTDDYMTKPPDRQELVLRIKALLRRARIVDEHRITIGDVELDYDTHTVRRGHEAQVLPPKEFNLLYKLLAYPEKTFTRLELLDEIWGMDSESDDKTVNVHINRLRTRFYDWPEFEIQTIRGIGYRAIKKV